MGGETHIGGVGDELPEEDLLVGVEGVDDEREQLVDLRLEGERLRLRGHGWRDDLSPGREESATSRRRRRLQGGGEVHETRVCGRQRGTRWDLGGCGAVGIYLGGTRGSRMFYQRREAGG